MRRGRSTGASGALVPHGAGLLLLLSLGGACGDDTPEDAAPAVIRTDIGSTRGAARITARDRDVEGTEQSPVVYEAPGELATPGVQSSIDRYEPSGQDWPTEVLHDLAKPELVGFVTLVAGTKPVKDLSSYLSTVFAGATRFVPVELVTVFSDDAVRVRRAPAPSQELFDEYALDGFLHDLLAPFADRATTPLGFQAKIFGVERDPRFARRFTTRALIRLDGPAIAGGAYQVNAEWSIGWEVLVLERNEIARIRKIEVLAYEDVRASSKLFSEVTGALLGEQPRFGPEFLLGAGEYHFRTDTLNGNVYAGQIGVTVGDVNGDGLDDLYVPQHGGLPNRLFVHLPDGTVEDRSEASGLALLEDTQSALFLDLDHDGDQDVALACGNAVVLGTNDGAGVFTLRRPALTAGTDRIKSLSAADWDADGDLDLYACIYSKRGPLGTIPVPYHDARNGPPNVAWRNDGGGRWSDATSELGFDENNDRFSYASVWEDLDDDGDLDLYVVNDFGSNNLYRNEGGSFRDVAAQAGAEDTAAGMGVTVSDVDLDGDPDLYVTNMWSSAGQRIASQSDRFQGGLHRDLHEAYLRHARGNTLLLNRGDGTFEDGTLASGARNGGWGWGAMSVDLNNDGLDDLYSPNGFLTGPKPDDL
jgi:hypothetical protein